MTKRNADRESQDSEPDEIRCPDCGYFLAEPVELEGEDFRIILKIICRSCRSRLLLRLSPKEVVVGQV